MELDTAVPASNPASRHIRTIKRNLRYHLCPTDRVHRNKTADPPVVSISVARSINAAAHRGCLGPSEARPAASVALSRTSASPYLMYGIYMWRDSMLPVLGTICHIHGLLLVYMRCISAIHAVPISEHCIGMGDALGMVDALERRCAPCIHQTRMYPGELQSSMDGMVPWTCMHA